MSPSSTTGRRAPAGDELLDAIVEALPVAVVAVLPDGRIARVNAGAERVFGYRREELVGAPVEMLLPDDNLPTSADLLHEYVHDASTEGDAGEERTFSHVVQCVGRRRDDAPLMLEVTLSPLEFADGVGVLAAVQDATVTRRVGERLAILEAFVETSEDAVFSHDADGCVTSWNRSSERIFGYLKDEIIGQHSIILFPDHLQDEAQLVFDTVTAGDRVDRFETEIRRKDGMPIPISLSLCPLFEGSGSLSASVLIARDLTEQRLAQATLAEIERRVREAEALAHVGSWLWDVRTGAVQWTDELHRIHGIEPLDFEGTFDAHVAPIHPEDQQRVCRALLNAVASGRAIEDEYRVARPDGGLRWVYTRAEPTIGSAGDVVGLRGISQDVTERRRESGPGRPDAKRVR